MTRQIVTRHVSFEIGLRPLRQRIEAEPTLEMLDRVHFGAGVGLEAFAASNLRRRNRRARGG